MEMAFDIARNTRKNPQIGACVPLGDFDAAGRQQIVRPLDRANLHGLPRRKPLKDGRLPAGSLLGSAQIRSDHFNRINGC